MSNKSSHNLGMRPKPRRASSRQEPAMGQTEERMYKFLKNKDQPEEEEIHHREGINASNDRSKLIIKFYINFGLYSILFNKFTDIQEFCIFTQINPQIK